MTTKSFLIGGIFIGISYVIATAWGSAFSATTKQVVTKIRCSKYKDDPDKYKKCIDNQTTLSAYLNALLTTILLALTAIFVIWITGQKSLPKQASIY